MKLSHCVIIALGLMVALFNKGIEAMEVVCDAKGKCRIGQMEYPAVGFGTYPYKDQTCLKAVEYAAKDGYRIIDTATIYQNFVPIGKILQKYGRQNFYVISKVWPDSQKRNQVFDDFDKTLKQLGTKYLDAYLIHWPNSKVPIEETLQAMEELRKKNLVRHIGLSNVTVNHLRRALEAGVPITWVQVEMSPVFYDAELIDFCHEKGIGVLAWAPLNRGSLSSDAFLSALGKKYHKTASQVALRWIVQNGCIPLPGSQSEDHILQNISIMDFELSREEMNELNQKAKVGQRTRYSIDEFDFSYQECWPKKK